MVLVRRRSGRRLLICCSMLRGAGLYTALRAVRMGSGMLCCRSWCAAAARPAPLLACNTAHRAPSWPAGEPHQFGLEVGSKAELVMVMARLAGTGRRGVNLVCNGFKDAEYMELVGAGRWALRCWSCCGIKGAAVWCMLLHAATCCYMLAAASLYCAAVRPPPLAVQLRLPTDCCCLCCRRCCTAASSA